MNSKGQVTFSRKRFDIAMLLRGRRFLAALRFIFGMGVLFVESRGKRLF
jgi:hypothetical protein